MALTDAKVETWPPAIRLSTRVKTPLDTAAPIARVRMKTLARTRAATLYLSAAALERPVRSIGIFLKRSVLKRLLGDSSPDTLTGFGQESCAHESFDDTRGSLGRHLERGTKSVDRDKGRATVDDFLENGSDDLRTAGRVATI